LPDPVEPEEDWPEPEADWPRHARTEVIPAIAGEHTPVWGSPTGRQRRRQVPGLARLTGAPRRHVVAVVVILCTLAALPFALDRGGQPGRRNPGPTPSRAPLEPTTYEAEAPSNMLSSGARIAPMGAASGGSGVYALGAPNMGLLRFQAVAVPATRTYPVTIYYQNPRSSERIAWISVNGGGWMSFSFAPTDSGSVRPRTISVILDAGSANTIEVSNPDDRAPDIDRIVVSGR
jgi:hypothetical protein